MQPLLEQGQSGGRDIFVVADYMAKQMHDLGYLEEINHEDLPTVFKNLLPSLQHPEFDPERKFSVPWQGGMTGIWVDTSKAPEIHSVNDLFDPKYKGKVTMLAELRETVPLVMLAEGVDPAKASTDQWLKAIERLKDAAGSGQIRRFGGNEYTEDLTAGNIVAAIGWSGRRVADRKPERRMADADPGLHPVVGKHGDPGRRPQHAGGARLHELRLPAGDRRRHHRIRRIHLAGEAASRGCSKNGGRNWPTARSSSRPNSSPASAPGRTRRRTWKRSTKPGRK